MSTRLLIVLILGIVIVAVGAQSLYRVHETERAILLQFGNVVDPDVKPGLHFKMPIAQEAKFFDARVITLDSPPERYYTVE